MALFTISFYEVPRPNPFMKSHSHPDDEILFFMRNNAEEPARLGGEATVIMGEEKKEITFTTTTAIYVHQEYPINQYSRESIDRWSSSPWPLGDMSTRW